MSAKEVEIIHFIPKSNKAQGACSLDEPHPKLLPAIKILALSQGFLFKINSALLLLFLSYLLLKKRYFPKPVLCTVFKNLNQELIVSFQVEHTSCRLPSLLKDLKIRLIILQLKK